MGKQFLVYCEICGYRKIAMETPRGIDGLVPIKTSRVPAGIPKLDPKTNKIVEKPAIEVMPKYKCPQCGRGVTTKRLPGPIQVPTPEPIKKDPYEDEHLKEMEGLKEDLKNIKDEIDG